MMKKKEKSSFYSKKKTIGVEKFFDLNGFFE